jgi:hypothetical protein
MNKYIKRLLLIVIMIFTCILTGKVNVYAEPQIELNIKGGKTGSTGGCGGGNCFSLGTGGIRIALFKHEETDGNITNTKVGKTIDIWYYDNKNATSFFGANSRHKICYKGKQFRNGINDANLSTCSISLGVETGDENDDDAAYKAYSAGQVLPNILSGMTNSYNGSIYVNGDDELNTRVPNATETIMKRIEKNLKEDVNGQPKYTYINNILSKMGTDLTAESIGGKYYLVVEPLIQWENSGVTGGSYNFFGTPSELTRIFAKTYDRNSTGGYNYVYNVLHLSGPNGSNEAFNVSYDDGCSTYDGAGINSCSYYYLASMGVGSLSSGFIPSGTNWEGLTSYDDNPGFKTMYNASENKTYGVGFISLYILDDGTCDSQARSIISKEGYTSATNYIDLLYGDDKNPHTKIREACFNDKNDKSTFNKEKCYQLLPEFVQKVGIIPTTDSDGKSTNADLCSPKSCEYVITYGPNVLSSKFSREGKSYVGDDNYLTSSLVSAYDAGIYYLLNNDSTFFKEDHSTDMLIYDNYKQLNVPASCSGTPDCKIESTVSCSGSGNFVLSDSSNILGCILKGYAYNNLKETKKFQTSLDSRYDTKEGNGYCHETVEFNFPTSPKRTKAGMLLQWGIGDVQKDGKFGTMKVTRKCWYGAGNGIKKADGPDYLDLSWVGTINPEIKLYYKDGLPTDGSIDISNYSRFDYKNLKISEPTSVKITEINGGGTNYSIEDYTKGFGWKDKTSIVNYFTSEATFDIEYGDSLNWFADKSDDGAYKDLTKVEKDDSNLPVAKYLPIGYGLPTSFITPTNSNYGGSINETEKMNGYLYVTVANIGTKSTGDDKNYHFNKYMAYNLTDDSKESKNDATNYLTYSCSFSIYNQLFGYEDGTGDNTQKPKGLDVVFRTIKLVDSVDKVDDVFPGRAGEGRDSRWNWKRLLVDTDEEYDPVLFEKLINNKIYDEKPLYHIVLTPSKIQDIRKKNKEVSSPYTNMTDELYVFSKNKLTELSEEEFNEMCKTLDCSKSEDKKACERTNKVLESICSKKDKYINVKDSYEPYKYAGSKFLSYLNENAALRGVCIDTYGSDTLARSEYYAKSEGCKSNLYLTN